MTYIASKNRSPLDLHEIGQSHSKDSWLVSDWNAGQSGLMQWSADNVRKDKDGNVELILSRAPAGSGRAYEGGEIQGSTSATTGTWSWTAQAPDMVPGAVFGMFTYKSDWQHQPWVEFDFEFVGEDTTKVHLAIHMEDAAGRHMTLKPSELDRAIIDLGFNAAEGQHTYEVTVTNKDATFYVDGKVVAVFSGKDMMGDVWNIGPMTSYVDLWAVDKGQEAWAGQWKGLSAPLVASLADAEIRPGEYGSNYIPDAGSEGPDAPPTDDTDDGASDDGIQGTDGNDLLKGHGGDDTIFGLGGDDVMDGKKGADAMHGGAGDDVYLVNEAGDRTIEAASAGHDTVQARVGWVLADHVEDLILRTGASIDGTGNAANNQLTGNNGANVLSGLAGADTLDGGGGYDMLIGGLGNDVLTGGKGADTFHFTKGDGHDIITDFDTSDVIEIAGHSSYHLRDESGGTRVVLSDTDSLFLKDVVSTDLGTEDFLFL
ncbi:family 16 glycosylhydrolase [Falsirhodobacter sp. 20TX0035]|uniref:family 16 glycosylhydrolase n=1 Tax=Falsirhodobacter sp. 20TX0035 TaxID=3022019 RepID=UPI00232F1487|nr:family 16 glycosylhydrolase [Falsirhodobacter sp. 20TX0035]MDB6453266.1 family 16 glycosylhydrolase [Falsirhodobacter sp. 20TX0035]